MANSRKIARFEPQQRGISAGGFAGACKLARVREPLRGELPLGRYPMEGR